MTSLQAMKILRHDDNKKWSHLLCWSFHSRAVISVCVLTSCLKRRCRSRTDVVVASAQELTKHSVQAIASSVVQDDALTVFTHLSPRSHPRARKGHRYTEIRYHPISMTRHTSSTHTTCSIMFDVLLRSLVGANCFQPGLCYGGSNNICRSHPKKAQPGSPWCRSTVVWFVCFTRRSWSFLSSLRNPTYRLQAVSRPGNIGGALLSILQGCGWWTHVDVWWCLGFEGPLLSTFNL